MSAGGGALLLPKGTSLTSGVIPLPTNVIVKGQGRDVTKVVNTSSDVFSIGQSPITSFPAVQNLSLRDFSVEAGNPKEAGGGHIFVLNSQCTFSSWLGMKLWQRDPMKQILRAVSASATHQIHFYDCLWDDLDLIHDDSASVSAFEVSSPYQPFNACTLRNLRCKYSGTKPFFQFDTGNQQLNNGCLMSQIRFDDCLGGMVHWGSAANWVIEGLVQYGSGTLANHAFSLGRGPYTTPAYGAASPTRHMTFINCDRRGPAAVQPFYDMLLKINSNPGSSDAAQIVLINCYENPGVNHVVEANGQTLTWIGFGGNVNKIQNRVFATLIGDSKVYAKDFLPPIPG